MRKGFPGTQLDPFGPPEVCRRHDSTRGFSLAELMIVVSIILILVSVGIPSVMTITRNLRIRGDTQILAAQVHLARMRAAADFTHARIYLDLNANTFHLEIWNKTAGCWKTEPDSNNCTQAGSSVTPLATGDTFGLGSQKVGPTPATLVAAQAPACTVGVAGAAGANIANTACIEFNSRSYAVDSTNAIVASDAIYVTNNVWTSAVTVSVAGRPTAFVHSGSTWDPL
jgi:prepilin-type N-terminal cleavage/methylation domain-containing protein